MIIKEVGVGFNSKLNIGKFSYCITMDDYGVNVDIKDLLKQAEHFFLIVINGNEPFTQREELAKFIKKISKINPYTTFEIHTNGIKKPLGLQSLNNITYYVNLQLKSSYKKYGDRIKPRIINQYNELHANFVFYIRNNNDFDDIEILVQEFGIKKSQITLLPYHGVEHYNETLNSIIRFVKNRGYNYSIDIERLNENG